MTLPGNLLTTAMGVMPHKDMDRALKVATSVDIPFWPQLPNYSYYEDMYVQASEHFPGIVLDLAKRTLRFSMEKFEQEAEETLAHFDDPPYFDISKTYSAVYDSFMAMDFAHRPAIRGQLEGPISFGFNVPDQNDRPILFDETLRPFMYEFMSKRINVQLSRLKKRNPNAFMFVDEPGLQYLFSAMSGYTDMAAKEDMDYFFSMVEKPRGVHLCGNPDWDFLLGLDMDILSLDVYTNGDIFQSYAGSIKGFLDRGGVLVWGIVPTNFEPFTNENQTALVKRQESIWKSLFKSGIDREQLFSQSLLSPATCCLINRDGEKTVEEAFELTNSLSKYLREKYALD